VDEDTETLVVASRTLETVDDFIGNYPGYGVLRKTHRMDSSLSPILYRLSTLPRLRVVGTIRSSQAHTFTPDIL
jgi:hypothetical protein